MPTCIWLPPASREISLSPRVQPAETCVPRAACAAPPRALPLADRRYEQRLEHDVLLEQQQRERRMQPYRAHEKGRQREAAAPVEVKRLEVARQRRFQAALAAQEEAVESNRQALMQAHGQWADSNRKQRKDVIKRIEAAQRERTARTEEHQVRVERHAHRVALEEARRQIRKEMDRAEREAFNKTQSQLNAALAWSAVGAEIITDTELEGVIAGERKKKPAR